MTTKPTPLNLRSETYSALLDYCRSRFLLPEDAVRRFLGIPPLEPFLVELRPDIGPDQQDAFLDILRQLYIGAPDRFDRAAPTVVGTERRYFGRTAEAVESTGSSNRATPIPGTPWFVSTCNGANRKQSILYDVMRGMGFSGDYAYMISWAFQDDRARLPRELDTPVSE